MEFILSLDVGTSSIRGTVYSLEGKQIYSTAYSYTPRFFKDGRVRQSPESWRKGVIEVLSGCGAYIVDTQHRILAISVTSQRASVIPMDTEGHPLYDAIMWQDITTYRECSTIAETMCESEVYSITGLRINPYFSAPKILWIKEHEPEIFTAASKFVGVQDYVVHILTGKFVTDYSQACRTLFLDISTQEWNSSMLEVCLIDASKLPELVPPGTIIGPLLSEISDATGLPGEVPIVLAGGDQQVAAIGMGVISEGTVEANTGTGSFIIAPIDTPLLHPEARTLCSVAAIPRQWVIEAGVLTTGILYSWFAKEFIATGGGENGKVVDYTEINKLVQQSPPGAHGIIALPHFKGSTAPFWNPYAKGCFFNLTLANTRSDMARALLESIVLEMGDNLKLIREILPHPVNEIVVAGGLTNFKLFNQLQSDVFDAELRLPSTSEASSLGALISGLVSLGIYADYQSAYNATQHTKCSRLYPTPHRAALYKETARLRKKLYRVLEENGIYQEADEYTKKLEK
ncbi:FGGY-family carbohydrate kinase [Thermodesulfobacteriota bacterium]